MLLFTLIASRRRGYWPKIKLNFPKLISIFIKNIVLEKHLKKSPRRRGQEVADLGGRTSEQGKDYLIGCNKLQIQQMQIRRLRYTLFRAGRRPVERVRLASDQIPREAVEQTKGTGNFLLLRLIIIVVIILLVLSSILN